MIVSKDIYMSIFLNLKHTGFIDDVSITLIYKLGGLLEANFENTSAKHTGFIDDVSITMIHKAGRLLQTNFENARASYS